MEEYKQYVCIYAQCGKIKTNPACQGIWEIRLVTLTSGMEMTLYFLFDIERGKAMGLIL